MSTFIEFIDFMSKVTIQAMMNSIWQGALITALVFGLVKLLRRTNAATRYAMWMVTLTAVFCLFLLNVWNAGGGYNIFNLVKFNEETQEPVGEMNPDLQQPDQVISSSEKPEETPVPEAENAESLLMTGSEMTSEGAAPNNYQIHLAPGAWHIFVFCAWFLITIFLLSRLIHSYFYSLHLKRSARQLPGKHQKMLGSWIYTQKIKRTIRICSSQQVTTPLAIGLFNPVVLIPESLLNKLNEAELKQVIAHELAHLRRRDDWTNLLQKIIEAFLFFHPAVLFLKNRLNLEREIACDDAVVSKSGENRQYIECLVHLVEIVSFSPKPVLASGALHTKKQIFKRIEALMQTNRTFKIGISIIGICAVLILITIGVYHFTKMPPLVSLEDEQEILTDVLTFEFSFGDEKTITKNEFLLANPFERFVIANNGDIIIADEKRLKVFDNYGNPKKIIGRPGQGPGEFMSFPYAYVMENGKICVTDGGRLSIYNPDYSFIDTKNFKINPLYSNLAEEKGWGRMVFNAIYVYSFDDILISTQSFVSVSDKEVKQYHLILHQQGEEINTIVESLIDNQIYVRWVNYYVYEKGGLVNTILPGRKVAYSETHKDKVLENGTWYYFIHIYDLDTRERTRIKRPYNPVAIPDSVKYPELKKGYDGNRIISWRVTPEGEATVTYKEVDKIRTKYLEELGFYPAIQETQGLLSDGNLIFAKTYEYVEGKGYVFEIFDIETGSYLRSTYFPFDPVIKNGYAYRIGKSEEGFAVVEKYKIDPAVYGK